MNDAKLKIVMVLILCGVSMSASSDDKTRADLLEKYGQKAEKKKEKKNIPPSFKDGTGEFKVLSKSQVNEIFQIKDTRRVIRIGDEMEQYLSHLMRGIEKNLYRAGRLDADGYPEKAAAYIEETLLPNAVFVTDSIRRTAPSLIWESKSLLDEINYWRIEMWLKADRADMLETDDLKWFDEKGKKSMVHINDNFFQRKSKPKRSKGSYARVSAHCVGCHQTYAFDE